MLTLLHFFFFVGWRSEMQLLVCFHPKQVTLMGSAEVLAAPTEKVKFMEDMKTEVCVACSPKDKKKDK